MSSISSRYGLRSLVCALLAALLLPLVAQAQAAPPTTCQRQTTANVVALDQPFFLNRLGALEATGMIFALKRDVVPISGTALTAGNVQLRSDKRPRPLVLRMNVGDCLTITFTNLLAVPKKDKDQVETRNASIHVMGMQLVNNISDDGSFVGANASSFAAPGGPPVTYHLFAQHEGGYVMYSTDTPGGEGDGGQQSAGLFGSINVEPPGARWYRSQVTKNILDSITVGHAGQFPIINYEKLDASSVPILNMLSPTNEIIKSDLTAMITGPLSGAGQPGRFPPSTFFKDPQLPDREQPFREFTIIYHDEIGAVQAFPEFFNPTDPTDPKIVPVEGLIDIGLGFTLSGSKDGFGINYGVAGIGAEVLANRLKVGPEAKCAECKYEEFFLNSWTIGDPAQIVDIPANTRDANGAVIPGPKATKVLYPDDPSNVYHSYISDHTKFRILHGGVNEHHIHHQHAHQWVHTPNSDNSSYDDSQAIGPGAAFTLEMTYNGGGNRNKTVGDSIFHCHFYPHFGQGMWSLWRTHDVFEAGTQLDANGRPVPGARAYPDGEIPTGSPIPALVPLPTLAMAPIPGAVSIVNGQIVLPAPVVTNPGYPFFVPAIAGHRPPHPPLFTEFDGGLPRHVITGASYVEHHTRLDFTKDLTVAQAVQVDETGTPVEKVAMAFHEVRNHSTFIPETGAVGNFVLNGLPRVAGAPFADPCINDAGAAVGKPRLYESADLQLDVKYNKAGWHFPQHRMSSLWQDVAPVKAGTRPPQPLFVRANTNDCITFKLTNLIPNVMLQDDFQVKASTDIVGQHIHLVKFDVASSDGAGNGWNYEEGAFSFQEVQERILAINQPGGSWTPIPGGPVHLVVKQHPFFNNIPEGLGAQTVVERWYADPTLNNANQDRTLRTVFTHDHFGPSNHQQAGLYAGLVIEPLNSTFKDSETGLPFDASRPDGGPTGWEAVISNGGQSFREFMMEFQDYALAYTASNVPVNPPAREEVPLVPGGSTVLLLPPSKCPVPAISTHTLPPPCPEAISADDVGTFTVNYRNEPIALRIYDPSIPGQAVGAAGDLAQVYRSTVTRAIPDLNSQPLFYPPLTSDLRGGDPYTPLFRTYQDDKVEVRILVGAHEEGHNFHVHGTRWLREPSEPRSGWRGSQMMGISEHFEFDLPPLSSFVKQNGVADFLYETSASEDDQWNGNWGIIRAYNGLRADLQPLPNNLNGNQQDTTVNIEDFNTSATTASTTTVAGSTSPALDTGGTTTSATQPVPTNEAVDDTLSPSPLFLKTVDTSVAGTTDTGSTFFKSSVPAAGSGHSVCPKNAPIRTFDITVIPASKLPAGTLTYNTRPTVIPNTTLGTETGPLADPTAIIYVRTSDLVNGSLPAGTNVEPLILRAAAGDCIDVTLRNHLPSVITDLPGYSTLPMIVNQFNANQILPSHTVGLHPEMLSMNMLNSDGVNIGVNPSQTVAPGNKRSYQWYAGIATIDPATNKIVHTPVEFGSVALMPTDPIKQPMKGAIGALIIEPQGSHWTVDANSRASANVTKSDLTTFREFVLVLQNDVNMRFVNGDPVHGIGPQGQVEDPESTAQAGFNYRTEPAWFRMKYAPETPLSRADNPLSPLATVDIDFTKLLSNSLIGSDPQTPVFNATPGKAMRLRLVQPGGHQRNNIFQLHGHVWEEEPYTTTAAPIGGCVSGVTIIAPTVVCSTVIADNPVSTNDLVNNRRSEWQGSQMGVGPGSHFDIIPSGGAGGTFKISGDYLFRTHHSFQFDRGVWGILRVNPTQPVPPQPPVPLVP